MRWDDHQPRNRSPVQRDRRVGALVVWILLSVIGGGAAVLLLPSRPSLVVQNASVAADVLPLSYAPLPMENPSATVAASVPLVELMQDATGFPIEIHHFSGYEQILQAFVDGDIDLAYLGPLPMIALQNDFPQAVPVVAFRESDGTTCYRCVLVESDGADQADERREANSTPVALTQPLSTCGYLSTMWLLNRRGLAMDSGDYTYVGSHEAVALAVARNEATVGGMKDTIAERYRGIGVRITDRTRRLPGFTMVANGATVSAHQIRAIRAALLQHDRDDLAGLDVGRYGFARPDEEAFRRVIDMLNESGISVSVQGMVQ